MDKSSFDPRPFEYLNSLGNYAGWLALRMTNGKVDVLQEIGSNKLNIKWETVRLTNNDTGGREHLNQIEIE